MLSPKKKDSSHLKRFAMLAVPIFAVVIAFGVVMAGFDGGNSFTSTLVAASGSAFQSGPAVVSSSAITRYEEPSHFKQVYNEPVYEISEVIPQQAESYNSLVEVLEAENMTETLDVYPVYCLKNEVTGEYYFTDSFAEMAQFIYEGWINEGIAYYAN